MCSSAPRRVALPWEVRIAVFSDVSRKIFGSIGAASLSGKDADPAGGVFTLESTTLAIGGVSRLESTTVATGAGGCAGGGGWWCSVVQPIENKRVDVIASTFTVRETELARGRSPDHRVGVPRDWTPLTNGCCSPVIVLERTADSSPDGEAACTKKGYREIRQTAHVVATLTAPGLFPSIKHS